MKKSVLYTLGIITLIGFSQCNSSEDSTLVLNLTDSEFASNSVQGVYVTITGMDYKVAGEDWQPVPNFSPVSGVNLAELSNGNSLMLSEFTAISGRYDALRFEIDAPEQGDNIRGEPASFIELNGGTTQPLYVRPGSSLVFEADGSFTVPIGETTEVIAEFGTPRGISLDVTGTEYILEPQIRVVDANKSGNLQATLSNFSGTGSHTMAYAFPSGNTVSPISADNTNPFTTALTWDRVEGDSFTLSALPVGNYDIYLVDFDTEGNALTQRGEIQALFIDSGTTTTVTIDGNNL
ncbi:MAG TPA: hypothetical protein DCE41_36220 [Cytophagales bacterium]|nr:hypothetical protein [Cytophagales bacterium]HAA21760.1 hypothetical protein [Cytophagales bacterium]HAP60050.1 hypothetical protein [Cytophagales bacterium]